MSCVEISGSDAEKNMPSEKAIFEMKDVANSALISTAIRNPAFAPVSQALIGSISQDPGQKYTRYAIAVLADTDSKETNDLFADIPDFILVTKRNAGEDVPDHYSLTMWFPVRQAIAGEFADPSTAYDKKFTYEVAFPDCDASNLKDFRLAND